MFGAKIKILTFWTKNALFWYFWTGLISTLKFVYLQNFTKKQKCINLEPKMHDLDILGLELENNIVIFEISALEFV